MSSESSLPSLPPPREKVNISPTNLNLNINTNITPNISPLLSSNNSNSNNNNFFNSKGSNSSIRSKNVPFLSLDTDFANNIDPNVNPMRKSLNLNEEDLNSPFLGSSNARTSVDDETISNMTRSTTFLPKPRSISRHTNETNTSGYTTNPNSYSSSIHYYQNSTSSHPSHLSPFTTINKADIKNRSNFTLTNSTINDTNSAHFTQQIHSSNISINNINNGTSPLPIPPIVPQHSQHLPSPIPNHYQDNFHNNYSSPLAPSFQYTPPPPLQYQEVNQEMTEFNVKKIPISDPWGRFINKNSSKLNKTKNQIITSYNYLKGKDSSFSPYNCFENLLISSFLSCSFRMYSTIQCIKKPFLMFCYKNSLPLSEDYLPSGLKSQNWPIGGVNKEEVPDGDFYADDGIFINDIYIAYKLIDPLDFITPTYLPSSDVFQNANPVSVSSSFPQQNSNDYDNINKNSLLLNSNLINSTSFLPVPPINLSNKDDYLDDDYLFSSSPQNDYSEFDDVSLLHTKKPLKSNQLPNDISQIYNEGGAEKAKSVARVYNKNSSTSISSSSSIVQKNKIEAIFPNQISSYTFDYLSNSIFLRSLNKCKRFLLHNGYAEKNMEYNYKDNQPGNLSSSPNLQPLIVLLPGLTTTTNIYEELVDKLVKDSKGPLAQVLCIDFPGRGRSIYNNVSLGMTEYVRIVIQTIQGLGLWGRPLSLIGYDLGANVAVGLACLYPNFVCSLTLLSPLLFPYTPSNSSVSFIKSSSQSVSNLSWPLSSNVNKLDLPTIYTPTKHFILETNNSEGFSDSDDYHEYYKRYGNKNTKTDHSSLSYVTSSLFNNGDDIILKEKFPEIFQSNDGEEGGLSSLGVKGVGSQGRRRGQLDDINDSFLSCCCFSSTYSLMLDIFNELSLYDYRFNIIKEHEKHFYDVSYFSPSMLSSSSLNDAESSPALSSSTILFKEQQIISWQLDHSLGFLPSISSTLKHFPFSSQGELFASLSKHTRPILVILGACDELNNVERVVEFFFNIFESNLRLLLDNNNSYVCINQLYNIVETNQYLNSLPTPTQTSSSAAATPISSPSQKSSKRLYSNKENIWDDIKPDDLDGINCVINVVPRCGHQVLAEGGDSVIHNIVSFHSNLYR